MRKLARAVTVAALGVVLAVTTSQVLTDDGLSWAWLYVSLAVAVLASFYSEAFASAEPHAAGGRRGVYLRQLRASVEDMEIVGIVTQSEFVLRTRQVYVDVSLARKPRHETAQEPYVGAVTAPAAGGGERRTLASFLEGEDSRVLAVIGGPGTGKTTLARSTALDLCTSRWPRRRPLPILLYLRDHKVIAETEGDQPPPGLAEVAASVGWLAGRVSAAWIERRLERGGCVVLLDGLDEVADEAGRSRVVAWVKRQTERYPDNRYVITSRPHGYHSNPLPSAEALQVRRFTGEQISRFLHGWYHAIERRASEAADARVRAEAARKAEDLIDRLRSQPALYDLAANPLLLTMIANVHRYRGQLPGSRAALYAEMCDVLLHRRSEARNLANATGLRGPQKERVMRHLALAMMREKRRDIPAEAAHRAIREPLRQVSRDVTSETSLEEARKSGLLVEREQGLYAFAHLTLQEYLAAAAIGRSVELLTRHVDDPWWRETTLLWAADANASPVIEACLASGTVRALALAFDCAAEAAEVDPALCARLDALLAVPETHDEERRRLVTGVQAARSLRETITLGDDTTLCARPVPRSLYALFARDEREAGRYLPDPPGEDTPEAADAPAVGMWAVDAARFVVWLNGLFDDGTTYALPTPEALDDPAVGHVIDFARHLVWTDAPSPRLHLPGVRGVMYAPDPGGVSACLARDRTETMRYARLALTTLSDRKRAMDLWRIFVTPLHSDPAPEPGAYPDSLRLLELLHVLELARVLVLDAGLAREADIPGLVGRARDLMSAPNPTWAMASAMASEIDDERERGMLLRGGADVSLVLEHASGLALDIAENIPYGWPRPLADPWMLTRDIDAADDPELRTAVGGFRALLLSWAPSRPRNRSGEALRAFDGFLAAVLSPTAPIALESLAKAIERAEDHLAGSHPTPNPESLPNQALRLVAGARHLITPILDRSAPFQPRPMACARIGLVAAIALLRRVGEHDGVAMLEEVLHGLIRLQRQEDGELEPNEVLLLVRT
jgi:KaiC/GvpD/RAD55 family RecA-like ATPase